MRVLACLLVFALAACDTAREPEPTSVNVFELSQDPADLVGTWELISVTTAGFGSPVTTTPVEAGFEIYTFRADGTISVIRDGVMGESATYLVETLPRVGTLLRIGSETDYRRVFFGVSARRFYIDHRPADGSLLEYARR